MTQKRRKRRNGHAMTQGMQIIFVMSIYIYLLACSSGFIPASGRNLQRKMAFGRRSKHIWQICIFWKTNAFLISKVTPINITFSSVMGF